MQPPLRFLVWLVGAALAAGVGAAAPAPAATPPATTGPIIELPVFEVRDSRLLPPPEKWRYAEIPGFEILSSMSNSATKRFVEDFLLLQEVMNVIMPGLRPPTAVPTSLILTGRGNTFEQMMPVSRGDDRYRTNTLFFQDLERGVIIVDFQLPELFLEDNTTIESDPYRGFYREYFRFLVRRNSNSKPPPWFEEGLVQLFASIDFTKKWINFAMVGDGFGGERTGDFNRLLQRRALIPLGDLFADPPPRRNTFWDAQAYAFVHMCLYGRNQKYQRPFLQFVTRLGQEPVSEALFKECFKMDYKKMALELRGYLGFTDHKYIQYTSKKGQSLPDPPPFDLRDAPDAVVGRIKGEALRLGGHGEKARNALIAPYVRGERDPRLLAALGLDEVQAGHKDRALKFLEAASQAKVVRARAYLELARLRFDAAREKPGAPNGQLDAAQVTGILTPLFVALKQPPPMAEVYSMVADTWSLSAVPPQAEHLGVVIEGIKHFPRDTALLMQTTMLAIKRGFPIEAKALAERGVKISRNDSEKDHFLLLAASIARDASPAKEAAVEISPEKSDAYLLKKP